MTPESDDGQLEPGVESPKVVGVGGDDALAGSSGTDDHVGVDDVAGAAGREQPSDAGRVDAVEFSDGRGLLPDEAGQADLSLGTPDGLCEGGCRDSDRRAGLGGPGEEGDHSPVVAIQRDEPAGIR